jgi:uncharacterized protein (DUF433 family)
VQEEMRAGEVYSTTYGGRANLDDLVASGKIVLKAIPGSGTLRKESERMNAGAVMSPSYVEQHDGGYWITGTRVSLDSVVYAFLEGQSPECIAANFSTLHLEEIYGVIAYYLGHRAEIDAYLQQSEIEEEEQGRQSREHNAELYQRLEAARKQRQG